MRLQVVAPQSKGGRLLHLRAAVLEGASMKSGLYSVKFEAKAVRFSWSSLVSLSSGLIIGMTSACLTLVLKKKLPQDIDGQECAGWEQITDHAEHQIRKGLTSPEESRDSIGRDGMTDDNL